MANVRDQEPEPLVVPLSIDGSEVLNFDVGGTGGIGGWAAYHSPATGPDAVTVYLRVGPETSTPDSPVEIRELHFVAPTSGSAAFSSPLMRTVPVARITAAINRPATLELLRPLLPPWNMVESQGRGSGDVAWMLPPREVVRFPRPRLRLKVPEGRRKSDSFYAAVADAYLAQAVISNRPARDLALANDIPVTTAHRWLKEARARGLLRLPRIGTEDGSGREPR